MSYLLIFLTIVTFCAVSTKNEITTDTNSSSLSLNFTETSILLNKLMYGQYDKRIVGQITALVNDYADKIFENVKNYMIRNGFDPVEIPDQNLKLFPSGMINLTKGWLEDTSTIARYTDAIVTYRSSMKKITFVVPIKFNTLMFMYKYHTKALFFDISGDTQGKLTNVRAKIILSFGFEKYMASLDQLDITDSGSISLTFSGNGLLDWITGTMTSVVSFTLHPILIRIIQSMVKRGLNTMLTSVNEVIENVLHH